MGMQMGMKPILVRICISKPLIFSRILFGNSWEVHGIKQPICYFTNLDFFFILWAKFLSEGILPKFCVIDKFNFDQQS